MSGDFIFIEDDIYIVISNNKDEHIDRVNPIKVLSDKTLLTAFSSQYEENLTINNIASDLHHLDQSSIPKITSLNSDTKVRSDYESSASLTLVELDSTLK